MRAAPIVIIWTPRPAWYDEAVCRGANPRLFYVDTGDLTAARNARAMCAVCPVQPQCLEYALVNDEQHGIWGGTTWRERKVMRVRRRA